LRALELAEPFPVVHLDTDAMEATRLLVDQALPGLLVVDHDGLPLSSCRARRVALRIT
jgi:CBS domain-containing protein